MTKTLYYGGSFNPIHHGHLISATAAAEIACYHRTVFIPAGDPWQKSNCRLADATDRLEMVRSAIADRPEFAADPAEVDRKGHTYTVDTAQQLLDRGESAIHWLIGADTLARLATWHRADRLFELVEFRVMQRPGTAIDWTTLPAGCRATPISTPAIDISSTDIRQRVAAGRPIDFLTPPAVVRYIAEHGLYRDGR